MLNIKSFVVTFLGGLTLLFCSSIQAHPWQPAAGYKQIFIWPKGKKPNPQQFVTPENTRQVTHPLVAGKPWTEVDPVYQPSITVYPPKKNNTGAAVMVFPGGGYWVLAMDLEGTEVCQWLNSLGITCVLLKYRVPGESKQGKPLGKRAGPYPNSPIALQDAQRAMGIVRLNAKKWHINPHEIGVIGFSAGGHLVAAMSTLFRHRVYPLIDKADRVSCRPDFAMVIYPGNLWLYKKFVLNPNIPVTKQTPPTFIVQAENDPEDSINNSLVYYIALKNAGVPVEMHLYAKGGHAFGLRPTKFPITHWPKLAHTWLESIGVLTG